MALVRTDLAVVALVIGVLALAVATALPPRRDRASSSQRGHRRAWLAPRLGGALTLLLLVRGATAGAVAVGAVTVTYALLERIRASGARR